MSDDPKLAESIGLLYLAGEFDRDPDMAPHISEEARREVALGLRLLEAVQCRGFVLVPREPSYRVLYELHGGAIMPPASESALREVWHNALDVAEDWRDEYPESKPEGAVLAQGTAR